MDIKKIKKGSIYALELEIEQEELNALSKFSEGEHISIADLNRKRNHVNRLKTQVEREKIDNDEKLFNNDGNGIFSAPGTNLVL